MTDIDARLESLFSTLPAAPDEAFVKRVDRAIAAEQKILAARAGMWRRFAVEVAGTIAVIAAFYWLWRVAPDRIAIDQLMHAPGMAASMILFIWLGVQLKPSATWTNISRLQPT